LTQSAAASLRSTRSVALSEGRLLHSSRPRAQATFSVHARRIESHRCVSLSRLGRRGPLAAGRVVAFVGVAVVVVGVVVVVVVVVVASEQAEARRQRREPYA
jgi:hypothetical protein